MRDRALQGFLSFCCHKCHTPQHALSFHPILFFRFPLMFRNSSALSKKTTHRFQQNNTSFSTKQHVVFGKTSRRFRQKHQRILQNKDNHHNNKALRRKCDTCDSKKYKIPVVCARTRMREEQSLHSLTFPLSHFPPFPCLQI